MPRLRSPAKASRADRCRPSSTASGWAAELCFAAALRTCRPSCDLSTWPCSVRFPKARPMPSWNTWPPDCRRSPRTLAATPSWSSRKLPASWCRRATNSALAAAIDRLLRDPAFAARLGRNARERAFAQYGVRGADAAVRRLLPPDLRPEGLAAWILELGSPTLDLPTLGICASFCALGSKH